jgi:hypothetical protein
MMEAVRYLTMEELEAGQADRQSPKDAGVLQIERRTQVDHRKC